MLKQDIITRTVQILDILFDEPPRILTAQRMSRQGKPGRLFQQMVPIPDAALFARLTAQVCKGDTIQITVTTEWREEGVATYLSDFALQNDVVADKIEQVVSL